VIGVHSLRPSVQNNTIIHRSLLSPPIDNHINTNSDYYFNAGYFLMKRSFLFEFEHFVMSKWWKQWHCCGNTKEGISVSWTRGLHHLGHCWGCFCFSATGDEVSNLSAKGFLFVGGSAWDMTMTRVHCSMCLHLKENFNLSYYLLIQRLLFITSCRFSF